MVGVNSAIARAAPKDNNVYRFNFGLIEKLWNTSICVAIRPRFGKELGLHFRVYLSSKTERKQADDAKSNKS